MDVKKVKFILNKQKIGLFLVFSVCVFGLFLVFSGIIAPKPGQNEKQVAFPVSQNREPLKKIKVLATAYSSDIFQTDNAPCISANGYDLCEDYEKYGGGNTIAANFLPFGTHVKLPELYGDKVFVVRDRMSGKYGAGRIDVWMPTLNEAKTFGAKYVEMELYGGSSWQIASK